MAYRLYDICARTGRAAEAQVRNSLAQEWPSIEDAAIRAERDCARGLCRSEGAMAHDRAGATALTGDGGGAMFKQAIQNPRRWKGDS